MVVFDWKTVFYHYKLAFISCSRFLLGSDHSNLVIMETGDSYLQSERKAIFYMAPKKTLKDS